MLRAVGGKRYGVLTSTYGIAAELLICIICDICIKPAQDWAYRHRYRGEGLMGSAPPWKYAHWLAEAETFSSVV